MERRRSVYVLNDDHFGADAAVGGDQRIQLLDQTTHQSPPFLLLADVKLALVGALSGAGQGVEARRGTIRSLGRGRHPRVFRTRRGSGGSVDRRPFGSFVNGGGIGPGALRSYQRLQPLLALFDRVEG